MIHVRIFLIKSVSLLEFTGLSLFRVRGSSLDSSNFSYNFKHTFSLTESASFQGEKIPVCVLTVDRTVWR